MSDERPFGTRYVAGTAAPGPEQANFRVVACSAENLLYERTGGTTSQRGSLRAGRIYYDSDVELPLVCDGAQWIDPRTGDPA